LELAVQITTGCGGDRDSPWLAGHV